MTLEWEEGLAVLQMVAAGKVAPEEAMDLLDALHPVPERGTGPSPHGGDQVLRVRFSDPPHQMDFTVCVPTSRSLSTVMRDVLSMLPEQSAQLVPPALLRGLESITVGEASDDTLIRLQDSPQELTVRRVGTESGVSGFQMQVRKGGDRHGKRIEFGW